MTPYLKLVMLFALSLTQCVNIRGTEETKKRLLANDPNYIHEIEVEMQDMKAKYYEIVSKVTDLTSKVNDLSTRNTDLAAKNVEIQSTMTAMNNSYVLLQAQVRQSSVGSVYIRWGRTTCPATAELIHTGYAAGSYYSHIGAAVNTLCLPTLPKWRPHAGTAHTAYVYGAEYEDNFHSNTPIDDYEMPCSVCRTTRSTVLMLPATTECLDGWTLEYGGDLASGRYTDNAGSEYICLDIAAERTPGLPYDDSGFQGRLIFPVASKCGTLPCPPYVENGRLACAVCSK